MSKGTLQRPFEVNEINPLRRALFLVFIDDGMHVHKLTYAALQFRKSCSLISAEPNDRANLRARYQILREYLRQSVISLGLYQ